MNEIIIDASLNQTRVAVMEDDNLVELYIERENHKRVAGNIYKGRVVNVLPGMQAAFVDIGLDKNAFLFVKEAIPPTVEKSKRNDISIKDVVKNGQEIIVQVIKEAMGTKGARVTTHITLPGRYLVLMPCVNYIGISRRITDETERMRLKDIVEDLRPRNMGVIVRTVGGMKEEKELKEDLKFLLKLWRRIENEKYLGYAPRIVYKDLDLIHRTIRDLFTQNTTKLIVNDKEKFGTIKDFVKHISPHLEDRVTNLSIDLNIFDCYGIENMIKNAISRKVWLKSGGYIIFDKTEALTVIDVNTGKYVGSINLEDTVVKTNKEASKEIAKQLRLRDIGGIIIVDFIDMDAKSAEEEVIEILKEELKKDKTKTNVLGISSLGLLEMTRKKVKGRLSSILEKKCPYCSGTGSIMSEDTMIQNIEKEIRRISSHTNAEATLIEVSINILNVLKAESNYIIKELERLLSIKVYFYGIIGMHDESFNVKAMGRLSQIKEVIDSYKNNKDFDKNLLA
ncbi:Rne/Rng family ribonuclease [Lutibacter sp. B2]|nr:Rne/Rng family ribonuclease [Lutibacter sp. B2]